MNSLLITLVILQAVSLLVQLSHAGASQRLLTLFQDAFRVRR